MDVLFGGNNHVEKGGDLLHIEDVHHANVGIDNALSRNVTGDRVSDGLEYNQAPEKIETPAQTKE